MAGIIRPTLILLLTFATTAPALAQKNSAPDVTVVQSGVDGLMKDMEFILLSNPKNAKQWKDLKEYIEVFVIEVDRDNPLRMDIILGDGPIRYRPSVPVATAAQLKNFRKQNLEPLGITTRRVAGTLYRTRGAFVGYMRYKNGYATFAEKKAGIPFNMPNPLIGIKELAKKYDLTLRARNKKTGGGDLMARRNWFQNNRKEIESAVKKKDGETQAVFDVRKLLLEHQLNEGERFYAESEELLIGWTTDVAKAQGRLDLLITPIDGTSLDESVKLLGTNPSHFANIERTKNAILSLRINHPLDSMRQAHFIELFKKIRDRTIAGFEDDADKATGTNIANLITKLLTENVDKQIFDTFVEVHSNAGKANTAVAAFRTANGELAVDILKEFAKLAKDKVKLDVAKEGDVRIHTAKIDIKKHPSFSFFVGGDTLYVGTSKDAVWIASGANALNELKDAIKNVAKPNTGKPEDPFVDVYVKVGPWLKLHQERRGNEGDVEARKSALEAFKPGIDTLTLQLRKEKSSVVGEMIVQTDILRYAGNMIAKFAKEQLDEGEETPEEEKTKK